MSDTPFARSTRVPAVIEGFGAKKPIEARVVSSANKSSALEGLSRVIGAVGLRCRAGGMLTKKSRPDAGGGSGLVGGAWLGHCIAPCHSQGIDRRSRSIPVPLIVVYPI